MSIVLIKLRLGRFAWKPVEIGEKINLRFNRFIAGLCTPSQVLDQRLRMDLLLDVHWRCVYDKIGPILVVLPAPDKLWVQITVPRLISDTNRALLIHPHYRLEFGRRNVPSLRFVVRKRFNFLLFLLFRTVLRHKILYAICDTVNDSIILLNSASTLAAKSDSIWYTSVNSANAQRPYLPLLLTPGTQYVSIVAFFSFASSRR